MSDHSSSIASKTERTEEERETERDTKKERERQSRQEDTVKCITVSVSRIHGAWERVIMTYLQSE